ncbi:phage N-6-adenine-methyltransferase [Enterobacter hormaechei]|uniref:DNA (cytosine-5-)-methyltransferase n=2 Tax=Enterobacter TaxID=547 RepID=A0A9Q2ZV15_9ENTR|nr:phage N-6-adenine-methyltransferase [Enterobacter hormaechei]MBT1778404.1 phage N-6-adenine-methyltransferase [Enterobacter hormaechei subsp. hoffmannii]MBT1852382.1 phage N-6-adenine-methyltransferase [Enterobacter hormaechei subsp. hoffmannii]MBW7766589.1 phage N-6-adenine-methyltransferase [Enterobacter hormaechei]MCE1284419.1 phage N-6-adenine-methyltransferase [Enterobacter hormaechei]MCE1380940.1 phage N-6-adenine-methyltransferase [Enterobacter hormaechei]
MKYGSVCSGIEAASKAWEPLGWKPAWFSEIEPFPSAILAHHWPEITNLGDMTQIADAVRTGNVEAPDVLVGGTPCQAFSIAGLREGLSDDRGQLTLSYVELANAIDAKRRERGEPEAIIVWENVPGVLSSKDNAFGCFLAGLAGESSELQPAGGKWTHAGCVSGPERVIAWRVLDAQFFGVAQRRRRVFVVASARKGFDPAEVLFELDSVRRDSAPRRETQKAVAALTARGVGTCGADDNQAQAGHLIAFGGGNTAGHIDVATACTAHGIRLDFDTETFAVHGTQDPDTNCELAHTLGRNNGQENACIAFSYKDSGADATSELSPTIRAGNHDKSHANSGQPPAIALQTDVTPKASVELAFTLKLPSPSGGGQPAATMTPNMEVRRLTPIECERLQGFPDNHTLIGWRGKDADECPDGPRYKAIGNSMAVPVMRWIGERIVAALPAEKLSGDYGGSKTPLDQRDLWRTPPALFAALDAEFCFQLDAAAAPHNALCRKFITAEQNTLETPWADYLSIPGYVWLNPPYSDITPFVKKAAAESANQIGTVMLVPADTSVGWFKEAIQTASEVRFITAGRLAFINPVTGKPVSGNSKGSILIIWRPYPRTHCEFTTVERDVLMEFGTKLLARREAA